MRRYLAPVLLLAAAGCLREPDPFEYAEPTLSVHGLLLATDTSVYVSLIPGALHDAIPANATVTLQSGATQIALHDVTADTANRCWQSYNRPGDDARCYGARLSQPIPADSRWELHASVSGETVTGSTRVPAPPTVVRPAVRERISYAPYSGEGTNPVTVEWQTAASPRVEIRFAFGTPYRGGGAVPGARCYVNTYEYGASVGQASGSRTVSIADVYCASTTGPQQVTWDSVIAPVLVTAYDSAYAEFALHGESVTRRPNASLQGAYGVFGSAASTTREVVLVPR
jgi:hypothetical protein